MPVTIPFLLPDSAPLFPDTQLSLSEPPGLLAAGGSLEVDWLLEAYRLGIFPWFAQNEPIMWWSPAPRTVLYPAKFHQSKSLVKLLRQQKYKITCDQSFDRVINHCADQRADLEGTWINPEMISAYNNMFDAGYAHSYECWNHRDELVGGLYGITLGQVFFGESMFSLESNASKLCMHALVGSGLYQLIDCQMATSHLFSLGASEINRYEFESALERWV